MNNLSHTEENYLKTIFSLSSENNGKDAVSTNAISDVLQTRPASVSDMIKKLSTKELVDYTKYKGVTLTKEGERMAIYIIRKHRLWEVFLVEKLGFNWDQVHDIAEQLEHIKSTILIERLDHFLGFPSVDPHGDPIPNAAGDFVTKEKKLLNALNKGDTGTVVGVNDADPSLLKYMDRLGIRLGTNIKVIDFIEFDKSLEIEINNHQKTLISKDVSTNIYIEN